MIRSGKHPARPYHSDQTTPIRLILITTGALIIRQKNEIQPAQHTHSTERPVVINNETRISYSRLLSEAVQSGASLPKNASAVNLCVDRYLFMRAFLAVAFRHQINLLPANKSQQAVADLLALHDSAYCIVDPDSDEYDAECVKIDTIKGAVNDTDLDAISAKQLVATLMTSGSTGQPKLVSHSWGVFRQAAELAVAQLGIADAELTVVSTVPSQHMYGLETTLFWPLASRLSVYNGQPFFPEDIRRVLQQSERPCLLISTPAHLNACVRAGLDWSNVDRILSATAPMSLGLAEQIEIAFQAPLFEIFGSTETLSFASRRVLQDQQWTPYPGVSVFFDQGRYWVKGGHIKTPCQLDDELSIDSNGQFLLTGRSTDLVKVAGKRASLTELNQHLNAIPGVDEGLFYAPEDASENRRLGALVVTTLTKSQVLSELRQRIEAVFVPRPLYIVADLPRNAVGKIIKNELSQQIRQLADAN